jgi:hypothetical protein
MEWAEPGSGVPGRPLQQIVTTVPLPRAAAREGPLNI